MKTLFSIGYSSFEIPEFIQVLQTHGVEAVADVRSSPYGKYKPEYNREPLRETLKNFGFEYVFLGGQCGARPTDATCFLEGRADFCLMAASDPFKAGLRRILTGLETFSIALLCAEKEPLDCHRNILICRNLRRSGIDIRHILGSGEAETNSVTEQRLLRLYGYEQNDLFADTAELLNDAYDRRGREIACRQEDVK